MTIQIDGNPQRYIGNGTNAVLPTEFIFFNSSDIVVTRRAISSGTEDVLVEDTHYSVTGGDAAAGADGDVTVINGSSDFTSDFTWTIERRLPLTQDVDYVNNDSLPAESLEAGADKGVIQNQDSRGEVSRAMRIPITDPVSAVSELPSSIARAGKALTFDVNGDPTVTALTTVGYGKVLLASHVNFTAASVELNDDGWHGRYDRLEIEVVKLTVSVADVVQLKPIDNGVVLSSNNVNHMILTEGVTVFTISGTTDWALREMDTGSASALSGRWNIRNSGGFISGDGVFTFRHSAAFASIRTEFAQTGGGFLWSGFEISSVGGELLTGTVRLWGLPKT